MIGCMNILGIGFGQGRKNTANAGLCVITTRARRIDACGKVWDEVFGNFRLQGFRGHVLSPGRQCRGVGVSIFLFRVKDFVVNHLWFGGCQPVLCRLGHHCRPKRGAIHTLDEPVSILLSGLKGFWLKSCEPS